MQAARCGGAARRRRRSLGRWARRPAARAHGPAARAQGQLNKAVRERPARQQSQGRRLVNRKRASCGPVCLRCVRVPQAGRQRRMGGQWERRPWTDLRCAALMVAPSALPMSLPESAALNMCNRVPMSKGPCACEMTTARGKGWSRAAPAATEALQGAGGAGEVGRRDKRPIDAEVLYERLGWFWRAASSNAKGSE